MKSKKKQTRKGSGRTKGSVSFVQVNLEELNRVLRGSAPVMVSRKFAEQLGLESQAIQAQASTAKKLAERGQNEIEVKVQEPEPID
jgi:hypothetical protein